MVPREEVDVWSEMGSGKRSFSCRYEREMLGTRFDTLLVWEIGKEEAHWQLAGGGCVMRGGGRKIEPMIMIPRAKQL
jgi:hypothetical protein